MKTKPRTTRFVSRNQVRWQKKTKDSQTEGTEGQRDHQNIWFQINVIQCELNDSLLVMELLVECN